MIFGLFCRRDAGAPSMPDDGAPGAARFSDDGDARELTNADVNK